MNLKTFLQVAVACAIGTGAAMAGWHYWQVWAADRAAAKAKAEAEAFAQTPQGKQRALMLDYLNEPGSAQFRNERVSGQPTKWCGEVNARNRMGGWVGFTRYMADIQRAKVWVAEPRADKDDFFEFMWRLDCEGK
jgi:hypothetical protein